jgi:hypothetical protein
MTHLCRIFRACLAGRVKVMSNYTEPKAYHLTRVSPFMLKTMENFNQGYFGAMSRTSIPIWLPTREVHQNYCIMRSLILRKQQQTGMIYLELS